MPTQIIDGFKLNSATPIDSRLVTTGTASRISMVYRYEGLRVYDTIQKKPFVYINGDWIEESGGVTTTTITGGAKIDGAVNSIPKIISTGTTTGTTSSNIREYVTGNERRIGINIPESNPVLAQLHVKGNSQFDGQVKATNFVGSLAADNITGILPLNKIQNADDPAKTYVLKSENNTNKWVLETTGSKILIDKNTTDTLLYLVFTTDKDITGSGNSLYIVNNVTNDLLAANAKTRQLLVGTSNNHINPQYSFVAKLGTGMYGNTSEVGLSMDSFKRIYVTSTMVGINIGTTNTVKFEAQFTTINTATSIFGTTNIQGTTNITGTTNIQGTTNIAGATNITGSNKLTVTGATTLSSTLAVTGATTLSSTLAVTGATTLSSTLAVTGATTLSSTLTISNNTSPGIKITSSGEFLRSIQSSGTNFNYMSFYKTDTATPSAANGRRGYIGYGSTTGDVFYINNETVTGSINFHTNGAERVNISNSNTTIKTPLIVESNVASALDSGLIIKDTSASNRGAFWMTPHLEDGQYNTIVVQADFGLIFSSLGYNTKNGSNGFAIAPHSDTAAGIRIDDTGRLEAHGGLTIGKKTSTSSHNGTIMQRIVVGSVNVARDGTHVINKGSSLIEFGVGSTSNAISPVAVVKFKNAMPSTNYSVFVSFSHNVNATLWTCAAEVIDTSNFKISVRRTNETAWNGVLEVSFMAVCYDN